MRLDKYLKVTRLIKRRTVANELASRGIFKINDKVAKPSSNIKIGDIIFLRLGKHALTVEVLKIEKTARKDETDSFYKIISDEIIKDEDEIDE